jgi:hypothetical protein
MDLKMKPLDFSNAAALAKEVAAKLPVYEEEERFSLKSKGH